MKFSAQEVINLPVEDVFALLSQVETYEAASSGRQITVRRKPGNPTSGRGAAWTIGLAVQDVARDVDVEIDEADPPNHLLLGLSSGDFAGTARCALTSLTAGQTSLTCVLEFKPLTLAARLLIQPMKLARSKLDGKYASAIAAFASELETQHARLV